MADLKNSTVLDKILEYAKAYGDPLASTLTAERYLLSIIDSLSGITDIKFDASEKARIVEFLKKNLSDYDEGFNKVREILINRIRDDNARSYMDVLYIQQRSFEAKERAKGLGEKELSPEVLLICIFDNPNDFIKNNIIRSNVEEPSEEGPEKGKKDKPFVEWDKDIEKDNKDIEKDNKDIEKDDKDEGEKIPEKVEEPKEDPRVFAENLTQKVRDIRDRLSNVVFGQETAIEVFASGYFQSEIFSLSDKRTNRPAGTFLFAGPSGVGKTFLVKNIVDILGMQDQFKCFDMSEYADPQAYMDLIGFGDNYKSPKEGLLTGFVNKNPKCILLFDEIEKANITTIHLFLQILDEGVLTDSRTLKRVSFKDTLIFFTTNAGKNLYNAPDAYDFSGVSKKVILKALQKDRNPLTDQPYFPAAICSRFASGNVVMFNHMSASSLCKIAESEIRKRALDFEKSYGIKFYFDKNVFSALLFSEGGNADARTLRGRAERFFNSEIFELFRLIAPEDQKGKISELQSINFKVELPADKEISSMFKNNDSYNILTYASNDVIKKYKNCCECVELIGVKDLEETKKMLSSKNISFVIVDPLFGTKGKKRFINIEDIESTARDIFWYVREKFADLPVYILQQGDKNLTKEEQQSYLKEGVRGFINIDGENDGFADKISSICEEIYQQSSMKELAASNNLVNFESGQRISNNGKTADITLFDFELSTAVDAEDTQNVMSNVSKPNVKFDSIIGAENAKEELKFFIEYLKDPKKFVESGLRAPKGVLLYGPPGTGKTMLAKAVATEAGVTFISAEGNQFLKKYIGEGKDELHNLFSVARKYAPAIIFIDEFEAIAKERTGGEHAAANGEDVLTALLTEMDGFNTDIARPVFVLAATNFDVTPGSGKSLDQALLRRFDSKICVDLPNKAERIRFIKLKCSGSKAFEISDEEIENIAMRSTGMSLADLDSIIELSLRTAIRKDDKKVSDAVLDEAFETFIGGEEKLWDASQLERIARHEAGHTFICWYSGETPSYVTVVARGDHGGYMLHDGNEGKMIYTKEELLARIRTSLGGRAAEVVYYGDKGGISTGASGDLASATNLAKHIICTYGMDEKFGLAVIDGLEAKGEIAREVREAVNKILDDEMKNAVNLISDNKASIDALVERLLSDNHLTGDEIKSIFESVKK